NEADPIEINFTHMVGKYGGYLYGFFNVSDQSLIFRIRNSLRIDRNDHLVMATQSPDGQFRRYIIANSKSGWLSAFELPADPSQSMP
ncbi:hypothetical protein, partial [Psychrobacter sp. 16-MNA-CIBAN-0192]|uniref:hypothetical protein n=1 Tax=Psychrobacter sp. 16-MNA-CIBAN-0192 TaxID=3140448 RepID=UPI00332CDDB4